VSYRQYIIKQLNCVKKNTLLKKIGGAWVAQLVEGPTLGFGSGHDVRVTGSGSSPTSGPALSRESA